MQKTTVMTFPKEFIAFMTETKKEARIVQKNIFSWQVIKGQVLRLFIYREYFLLNILAILLGRLTIMGDLSPFGLAFLRRCCKWKKIKRLVLGFGLYLVSLAQVGMWRR